MKIGDSLGPYRVLGKIGEGGPASARARDVVRELWRGLAEAHLRTRC